MNRAGIYSRPPITLTPEQRQALDAAVLQTVRATPGTWASGITVNPAVSALIATLPAGKLPYRYVDGSLQRLRKAGHIESRVNGWHPTGATTP